MSDSEVITYPREIDAFAIERYCQQAVLLGDPATALRAASNHYALADSAAVQRTVEKLNALPMVANRLRELTRDSLSAMKATKERYIHRLDEIAMTEDPEKGPGNPQVKAIELLLKMQGHLVERHHVTHSMDDMSEEALHQRRATLMKQLGPVAIMPPSMPGGEDAKVAGEGTG
jgi:hypothetical protein